MTGEIETNTSDFNGVNRNVDSPGNTSNDMIEINKEVSNAVNSNLEFSFKLDKKLISGVKIQVGSLLIDTSLSNKLRKTKQAMIE